MSKVSKAARKRHEAEKAELFRHIAARASAADGLTSIVQQPSTSTPLPPPHDELAVSPSPTRKFPRLPPEIWDLVFREIEANSRKLHDLDQHDGDWRGAGESDDDEDDERVELARERQVWSATLKAVGGVNREFYQLTSVLRYQSVFLRGISLWSMLKFFREAVPVHGPAIRTLSVDQAIVIEKSEGKIGTFYAPLRQALVAFVILMLPNLNTLEIDYVDQPTKPTKKNHDFKREVPWPFPPPFLATQAMKLRATSLTRLILPVSDTFHVTTTESDLADLLSTFVNLANLTIEFTENSHPTSTGRDRLFKVLTSFSHLDSLSLLHAQFVNKDFAALSWQRPLHRLALSHCRFLPLESLVPLLSHHAETLHTLQLQETPAHAEPEVVKRVLTGDTFPFSLVSLSNFHLEHEFYGDSDFLSLFDDAPISFANFGYTAGWRFPWEMFIEVHTDTLAEGEGMRFSGDHGVIAEDRGYLREFAEDFGIKCVFMKGQEDDGASVDWRGEEKDPWDEWEDGFASFGFLESTMGKKSKSSSASPAKPDAVASTSSAPPAATTAASSSQSRSIDVYDLKTLKLTVDDAVRVYFTTKQPFTQSHLHTDVRLVLGWSAVLIGFAAAYYGYTHPFHESKLIVGAGVAAYALLSTLSWAYIVWVEKDEIFVGKRRTLSSRISTEILTISSTVPPSPSSPFSFSSLLLPKPSAASQFPSYTLSAAYVHSSNNNKSLIAKGEKEVTKAFAEMVDENGRVSDGVLDEWLEGVWQEVSGLGKSS
ncbi:hypothetical protein MNV49_001424 [Pseudohyphozyma bogoriensis]|nr:hypothetical protein MNV49_001424 [Pseudohyphozyma bogoriensis]